MVKIASASVVCVGWDSHLHPLPLPGSGMKRRHEMLFAVAPLFATFTACGGGGGWGWGYGRLPIGIGRRSAV